MTMLLNESQLITLRAAMNRIIPPDDFPGAWEAGTGDYLLRQLETGDLQSLAPTYRDGLDALDAESQLRTGYPFADLSPIAQDALLRSVEKGDIQTNWATLQRFFDMLVRHTSEGYYADPGNGGNHDAVSWRMIGFKGNNDLDELRNLRTDADSEVPSR